MVKIGPKVSNTGLPTFPPLSFQPPKIMAIAAAPTEAYTRGLGKNLSLTVPRGRSQPNTYQNLLSAREDITPERKVLEPFSAAIMVQGHTRWPEISERTTTTVNNPVTIIRATSANRIR